MSPAVQELQRASLAIGLEATYRALEQPPLHRQPDWMAAESEAMDREANFAAGFQVEPEPTLLHREDEELFRCLTCEDTGEVEVYTTPQCEPWNTRTVACSECNADGAR